MKILVLIISLLFPTTLTFASGEITPYKFTDSDQGMPVYKIPESFRFTVKRSEARAPDVVYYFSKPKNDAYPIAILCGVSSSKESISSIIHFHRYFLQEFLDLGIGVLTVEQRGVDGDKINAQKFMEHYTRSQRLQDHRLVIEHLKANPPKGWDGKIVLLGVSEGGPIVTTLTCDYSDIVIATINWCGAGDWSWREELWAFLQKLLADNPDCPDHKIKLKDCKICSEDLLTRERYDVRMGAILGDPTPDKYFLNMTHKYHADALTYPAPDYCKICTPFLVVSGVKDTAIHSSDEFVGKAKAAGAPITYERVEDMDHYVRKRPDIIEKSFRWLQQQIK